MKRIKYFIPAIILMIIIFLFSNQTGSESSGLSTQIVLWLENNLNVYIPEIVIRKGAHMSEYALLTTLFFYGYYKNSLPIKKVYFLSIISTFLYACSDEIHQLFIGGRAGQFTDVLIDTTGGIIATIIIYIFLRILKRHEN